MKEMSEIQDVLLRMSKLLLDAGMVELGREIYRLAEKISVLNGKEDEMYPSVRYEIRGMYGGMGSLNDIVLQRSGVMLKDENDEFDRLRVRLYNLTF